MARLGVQVADHGLSVEAGGEPADDA
jgi:hypothetical protein